MLSLRTLSKVVVVFGRKRESDSFTKVLSEMEIDGAADEQELLQEVESFENLRK